MTVGALVLCEGQPPCKKLIRTHRRQFRSDTLMNERFSRFSHLASTATGSPFAFVLAALTIVVWAFCGPVFHYSDTWQLVINTGTTIVTFLMVFLIQNAQNRDTKAIHLKIDELIRASTGARNKLIDLDALNDRQLEALQAEFARICADDGIEACDPSVEDRETVTT